MKALCIKWAHARARTNRWTEEVTLLSEEMCRMLVYFVKRAEWWEKRATMCNGVDAPLSQGLCAYTFEHAEMYRSMGQAFWDTWQPVMVAAAQGFWQPGREEQEVATGQPAGAVKNVEANNDINEEVDKADNIEDMDWGTQA